MRKFPEVRQISWQSIISQFILLLIFVGISGYVGQFTLLAMSAGVLLYAIYYAAIKHIFEKDISYGIRLVNLGEFKSAIVYFQTAYDFFSRHDWLDRFRFIFLHTSTMSYREMSLIDIAVCYSQMGDGPKSKHYYQRTIAEFPESMMATVALKAIKAFEADQKS